GKGEPKRMERTMMGAGTATHTASQPRIYPMAERIQRPAAVQVTPAPSLEEPSLEEESVVATTRPGYKMAAPTQRRPFGGRAITRDNMDVPAFMRKQMD